TKKGIGPVYADKVARQGIRMGDLLDKNDLRDLLSSMVQQKNIILTKVFGHEPLSFEKIYQQYLEFGQKLAPYICDTTAVLQQALHDGKIVMLEGAQGTLLDPDFGTYPYATSSSPLAAGACLGSGIGPRNLSRILGIYKAYCTRVGGGPFPTELDNEIGNLIRERAHEYGTTTGRPRRCGWFDGVAGRLAYRVNGFTGMAITRFDILDELESIKICTAYKIDGKVVTDFPANIRTLEKCEPVYEEFPGWQKSTCEIRNYKDLPANAKKYIRSLEEVVGCPANIISVGPERGQTIEKKIVI
ncbi:MAG TPA: adenylosuccinate synthase, partial [Dehalococcoidales bacterium]|nr:adenylosuccinate synthase [Dehalococcoidales bacterium]